MAIYRFQKAVRSGDYDEYKTYAKTMAQDSLDNPVTLRSMWQIDQAGNKAVPISEVEPVSAIVKRFKSGAMSFGALSEEAHETIAIAMNRLAPAVTLVRVARTATGLRSAPTVRTVTVRSNRSQQRGSV